MQTDTQTDRQTDGWTDGRRTDGPDGEERIVACGVRHPDIVRHGARSPAPRHAHVRGVIHRDAAVIAVQRRVRDEDLAVRPLAVGVVRTQALG